MDPQLYLPYLFRIQPKGLFLGTDGLFPLLISSRITKQKFNTKGKDSIMNEHKNKSKWISSQNQVNSTIPPFKRVPWKLAFLLKEKPKFRGEYVPSCTHQSNLPYYMEPVSSQMSVPCSSCQALGQPVTLQEILKGRSSGQMYWQLLGPYLKIPQVGSAHHEQHGSWLAHQNLLLSPNSFCSTHDRSINQQTSWSNEWWL